METVNVINAVISEHFCCNVCSKQFTTHKGMHVHMSRIQRIDMTTKETSAVPNMCLKLRQSVLINSAVRKINSKKLRRTLLFN